MNNKVEKVEQFLKKYIDVIFLASIIILSLIIRALFYDFESHDYNAFLTHWFDTLKTEGFSAFKEEFSDYPPLYLYLMWIMTFLPVKKIYLIKTLSVAFDFMLAFYAMKIVALHIKEKWVGYLAFGITLFLPTVILNGAVWGQCDVIYTSFLIGSLYYFMKKSPFRGMIFYSIAFSLKLQSVFIAPLLVFLFIKGLIKFKHFLLIPAAYLILAIPSVIAGRSIVDLATIYFRQYDSYPFLTLACPNFYHWLGDIDPHIFSTAGIILTGAVVILLLYAGWSAFKGKDISEDKNSILSIALIFSLILPYFLPRMHERYFFPADLISLIWAFYNPGRAWIAAAINAISLFSYIPYLFGPEPLSFSILAVAMLAVIVIVILKTGQDILSLRRETE